jgi:hypothetical protein
VESAKLEAAIMFLLVDIIELLTSPLVAITIIGTATVGVAFLVCRTVLRSRVSLPPNPTVTESPSSIIPPSRQNSDPFDFGSSRERRSSIRRMGGVIEVRLADAQGVTEIGQGLVLDRSMGGLGLEVNGRVEPGTVVSVRPSRTGQRSPWIQMEIVSCEGEGDCWRVGCKFVRTPPWSVMLLFA